MTNWFNRLNLTPTERRLVLVAMVIVAFFLNYWLIWPYFGEWQTITQDMAKLEREKVKYLQEIGKQPTYEKRLQDLQRQGAQVRSQEAANWLQQTVNTEASSAGVLITRTTPQVSLSRAGGVTNQFFEERILRVDVEAGENELVNFLYRLGAGDSMIRVREVGNLRLHPTKTKLQASLDLVASFPLRDASPPPGPASPSVAAASNRQQPQTATAQQPAPRSSSAAATNAAPRPAPTPASAPAGSRRVPTVGGRSTQSTE